MSNVRPQDILKKKAKETCDIFNEACEKLDENFSQGEEKKEIQNAIDALVQAKDAFYVIRSICDLELTSEYQGVCCQDAIRGMLGCTIAVCDGGLYALGKIGKEG